MKHIGPIFIITYILLTINCTNNKSDYSVKEYPLKEYQKKVISKFDKKENAALINSYITGNKRRLTKKQKRAHSYCNIQHFFTPSGIHVAPILFILSSLLARIKLGNNFKLVASISLTTVSYILCPFLSINRILVLKFFNKSKQLKKYFSGSLPFYLAFVFDFLFGGYSRSPLSFTLSFLFLGIIFFSKYLSKIQLCTLFFAGQILIAYFFKTNITYGSFIFSPILTTIFSAIFPFLFFMYFIPWSWSLLEPLVEILDLLISICGELSIMTNTLIPTIFIIVAIYIFILSRRAIILFLGVLLIILSPKNIYNLPSSSVKKDLPSNISKYGEIKKVRRTTRGYVVEYSDLTKCYPKLYNNGYFEQCTY